MPLSKILDNLENYEKHLVVALVLLGLVLRIIWASVSPRFDPINRENPFHGDASGYHLLAVNLWRGNGLSWDGEHYTAFRMPGYPYFLWIIYSFSNFNFKVIRFVQAILGGLTVIPVILVGKFSGGRIVGLIAGLGTAIHPLLIYMTSWLYSETLFIFFFWFALFGLITLTTAKGFFRILLTGIGFGVASLIRPEIYLFLLFVSIVGLFLHWNKEIVLRVILAQLIVVVIVLPWTIRSTMIFKTFTPLTTSPGSVFYAGNNPEANGGSILVFPLDGVSEPQSDQIYFNNSINWIRSNPMIALGLVPKKILKFFSPIEFETKDNPIGGLVFLVNGIYSIFLLLGLFGVYNLRRNLAALIVLSAIIWYLITAIIYFGGSRVALPIIPGLMIFGAAGIIYLFRRMKISC